MARRVRILIAHEQSLFRDALGFVLGKYEDLMVVADAGNQRPASSDAIRTRPDVPILSVGLFPEGAERATLTQASPQGPLPADVAAGMAPGLREEEPPSGIREEQDETLQQGSDDAPPSTSTAPSDEAIGTGVSFGGVSSSSGSLS